MPPAAFCIAHASSKKKTAQQKRAQAQHIERRVHLRIIVEVAIDRPPRGALRATPACGAHRVARLAASLPRGNASRPASQRGVVVAARIQLLGAVQAQVHEVRRHVFEIRELAGRIRDDERDAMATQQRDERGVAVGITANLDRMPQRAARQIVRNRRLAQTRIVVACAGARRGKRAWQTREKLRPELRVELHVRGKLPEQRPELAAEQQHAAREKIRERRIDVAQAADMRDVARALDREHEIARRLVVPTLPAGWVLQRVERAVDLDRIELLRGKFQFALVRELVRIEDAAPTGVPPARNADADARGHAALAQPDAGLPRGNGSPLFL